MNKKNIGLISALISSLIWGFTFVSSKVLLDHMTPMTITFFRYIIATIFLFILLKIMKAKQNIKRKDVLKIAISGTLGITLYFYLEAIALQGLSASMVGLINGTIPIFTLLVEILFLGKSVRKTALFAFVLSACGIFMTVMESFTLTTGKSWISYIFMIVAIACWIAYTFITEDLAKQYNSICILAYQTLFATIPLIPFAVVEIRNTKDFLEIISSKSVIINLIFLGVLSSAIAYYLYVVGLDYLGNSTASIFLNFIPIASMIGAYFMLNEAITYTKFIGLCMVVMSIVLINFDGFEKWEKNRKVI